MKNDEITVEANAEMVEKMLGNVKLNVSFSEMNNFAAEFAKHIEIHFLNEYGRARASKKDKDLAKRLLGGARVYADALSTFCYYCEEHNFLMPATQSIIDGRADHMMELCDKAEGGFYYDSIEFCGIPIVRIGVEDADED